MRLDMAVNGIPNNTHRRVPVAIFGLGRAGGIHFGNLVRHPRAMIRYLVEEYRDRAERLVSEWHLEGTCEVVNFEEAEKVYRDPSVLAVIVCTPTSSHEQIVKAALRAGKAVFCEKPIASAVDSVDSCYEEAEKHGKLLYCAFNRRYDPSIRLLQQRVREGALGQVHSIKTCSRDFKRPSQEYLKVSGGIFHDSAIHDIDIICWILGEFPELVFAVGHAFHNEVADCGDKDQVNISLKFPSGCIATIDMNREASYGYDQRIEVFGPKGMLETRNSGQTTVTSHLGNGGSSQAPIETMFSKRYAEAYALEMDYFLNYVLGLDDRIEVTRKDSVMVSVIAEACHQSCQKGIPMEVKHRL